MCIPFKLQQNPSYCATFRQKDANILFTICTCFLLSSECALCCKLHQEALSETVVSIVLAFYQIDHFSHEIILLLHCIIDDSIYKIQQSCTHSSKMQSVPQSIKFKCKLIFSCSTIHRAPYHLNWIQLRMRNR